MWRNWYLLLYNLLTNPWWLQLIFYIAWDVHKPFANIATWPQPESEKGNKKGTKIQPLFINNHVWHCFRENYSFNLGQKLGYSLNVEQAMLEMNTEEKWVKQSAGMWVSNRVKGEGAWGRGLGGGRGRRGKSAAMCWGVHLYPEQVFSAPLAGPLIRNRHACLTPSKTSLSPISAAQTLGKMMVN